jgi:hypothetical protein
MSHTTRLGLETEMEHLGMIANQFNALDKEIQKDIDTAVSPEGSMALHVLREIAAAGSQAANAAQERMRTSLSANHSSH